MPSFQQQKTSAYLRLSRTLIFLVALHTPMAALALERVVVVPHSQAQPSLPHLVYEGARVTLKAAIQNTDCLAGYDVAWDVDQDGDFDDEISRLYSPRIEFLPVGIRLGSVWEIGRSYLVPHVPQNQAINITVRVMNRCNQRESFGTYRMFVYDFEPSSDPREWTDEQLRIMASTAAGEAIWYMYRDMDNAFLNGLQDESTYRGSNSTSHVSGLTTWLLGVNSHLPAYPPGSYNDFGEAPPDDWELANNARFNNDPYAEASMRLINGMIEPTLFIGNLPFPGQPQIGDEDEANTCGFNENGEEVNCVPIPGTDDNAGVYGSRNSVVYMNGMLAGSLSVTLPVLANTRTQVGPDGVIGQSYQWYVQQVVDTLSFQQWSGSCDNGGWSYGAGIARCGAADASAAQWAVIGLEVAEIIGRQFGVIVNNRVKYRIPDYLANNQGEDGLSGYMSMMNGGNIQLTGGPS